MYTPKELALRAAKALDDRKGLKIRLLQVTDVVHRRLFSDLYRHVQHACQDAVRQRGGGRRR